LCALDVRVQHIARLIIEIKGRFQHKKKTSVHPSLEKTLGQREWGADAGDETWISRRGLCNQVGLEVWVC
jgi:hypothetical protein